MYSKLKKYNMFTILIIAFAIVVTAILWRHRQLLEEPTGTKTFYSRNVLSPNPQSYRDPRHYEKTGSRLYRVNEMKYDNHTKFVAEYFIPGDDRWYTFNEQRTLEKENGDRHIAWMPIEFKTIGEAFDYCQEDKRVLRNETLLETIVHPV